MKLIILLFFVLNYSQLYSQQTCEDFESITTQPVLQSNYNNWYSYAIQSNTFHNPNVILPIDMSTSITPFYKPSNVLFFKNELLDDLTFIINPNDYDGDWTRMNSNDCFCYEFKLFDDGDGNSMTNIPFNETIYLFKNFDMNNSLSITNNGNTNPEIGFKFIHSSIYSVNTSWRNLCLPIHTIGLNDPLPSNSFGYWVPFGQALGGFSSYQLAWNSLLQNVTEVGFVLNNMANNVNIERLLLDNICLSCTTERPTNDGAYCCKGENLVQNGNFEFGNIVFT